MEPTRFDFDLAKILHPITPAQFFAEYYEKKPLLIRRNDPSYFGPLLSLETIDEVITTHGLSHPTIEATNAAKRVTSSDYTYPSGFVDTARLYQRFAEGATIILPQLHDRVPALAQLCRAMETELSARFQTNIYLTPGGDAQGFKTHFDSHDVFVLQVSGTKHWSIFDTPVELPYRTTRFDPETTGVGDKTDEFDLNAGDTYYIPRGVMHHAVTMAGGSLHITLGLLHASWTDLLVEAIAQIGMNDVAFRRALPSGFARDGFDRAAARAYFKDLLATIAQKADLDGALDHFVGDLVSTRHPLIQGQMQQIMRLDTLSEDSLVGVRPHLLFQFNEEDERVRVSCFGRDVTMPAFVGPTLRHALAAPKVRVGDLEGELDGPGKVVLVRKLVLEGMVRFVD